VKSADGEVTAPDDVLVMDNLGMINYKPSSEGAGGGAVQEKGRLFIKVKVMFPSKMVLEGSARENLEDLLYLLPTAGESATATATAAGSKSTSNSNNNKNNNNKPSLSSKQKKKLPTATALVGKKGSMKSFGEVGRRRRGQGQGQFGTQQGFSPFDGASFGSFFFR
jgi:hypothetical protein